MFLRILAKILSKRGLSEAEQCKFCGKEAMVVEIEIFSGLSKCYVECLYCSISTGQYEDKIVKDDTGLSVLVSSKELAIQTWNNCAVSKDGDCLFCGNKSVVIEEKIAKGLNSYYVKCLSCSASTGRYEDEIVKDDKGLKVLVSGKELAVAAWNNRAEL
jgi:transcription elongation factor Elf1